MDKVMTKADLMKRLASLPDEAPMKAEHADLGEGGNVKSGIVDVIVEDGEIVLVTDHAI